MLSNDILVIAWTGKMSPCQHNFHYHSVRNLKVEVSYFEVTLIGHDVTAGGSGGTGVATQRNNFWIFIMNKYSESLYFGVFPTASHPFIWSSLTQPYIKNITNISRYNGNCDFSVSYLWETIFISHLAENMQKGNYSLCHHNKKILVILMLLLFLLEEVKCGLCTWLLVIITIYFFISDLCLF